MEVRDGPGCGLGFAAWDSGLDSSFFAQDPRRGCPTAWALPIKLEGRGFQSDIEVYALELSPRQTRKGL